MNDKSTLKKKQIARLVAMLAVLAVILLGGIYVYNQVLIRIVEKDMGEILLETSGRGQQLLKENLDKRITELHSLADSLSAEDITGDLFLSRLEESKIPNSYFIVTDIDGKSIYSDKSSAGDLGKLVLQETVGREQSVLSLQDFNLDHAMMGTAISVPVRVDGVTKGILTCLYDMNDLNSLLESSAEEASNACYVMKKTGEAVMWPLDKTNPLDLSGGVSFEAADLMRKHPILETLKTEFEGNKSGYFSGERKGGKTLYISYTPLGINDWYYLNLVSTDIITNKTAAITRIVWLVGLFIVAVTLVLLFFLLQMYRKRGNNMEQEARFDKLTGLPNWKEMMENSQKTASSGHQYVFVIFHINHFKRINTVFGFEAGGRLLRDVAYSLQKALDEKEYACRISEDYFSLLLYYSDKDVFTKRLDALFSDLEGLTIQDSAVAYDYEVTYSGGVCLLSEMESGESLADIRDRARSVMEESSPNAVTRWRCYDDEAKAELLLKRELEKGIVKALNEKEFIPYFQPQYDIKTRNVTGAELLARWNHPEKGIILPKHFIPIMEKAGCILDLDMNMLEAACKRLKNWIDQGILPVPITINISRLNIHRQDFLDRVRLMVERYQVPPNLLALEISEKAVNDNLEKVYLMVQRLKQFGFLIIMDDSGSGRISLETLQKIPLDYIKMDRNFIIEAAKNERKQTVFSYIKKMSQALRIVIVAKAVETEEQVEILKSQECEVAQGHYFAEPMPEIEFVKLIFEQSK